MFSKPCRFELRAIKRPFFDNASGNPAQGVNENNIFNYNPQTGEIAGQSQTGYGQRYGEYRVSQVRVTELIVDP
jgi:hypothetical protein